MSGNVRNSVYHSLPTDEYAADSGSSKVLLSDSTSLTCSQRFFNFCHVCADTNELEQKEQPKVYQRKMVASGSEVLFSLVFAYGWDWFIHDVFCDFLFKCGCTWIFTHNWEYCNFHNESGPKCPWCMASPAIAWTTTYLVQVFMFASFIYLLYKRAKLYQFCCFTVESEPAKRLTRLIVVPVLCYLTVGTIVGAIFAAANPHYHVFIFS